MGTSNYNADDYGELRVVSKPICAMEGCTRDAAVEQIHRVWAEKVGEGEPEDHPIKFCTKCAYRASLAPLYKDNTNFILLSQRDLHTDEVVAGDQLRLRVS